MVTLCAVFFFLSLSSFIEVDKVVSLPALSTYDFFIQTSILSPEGQEKINRKVIMELEKVGNIIIKHSAMETDAIDGEAKSYCVLSIEERSISLSISELLAKKTKKCSHMIWSCAANYGEAQPGDVEERMMLAISSVLDQYKKFIKLSNNNSKLVFHFYVL
jgi:hypothetical protein